MSCSVPFGEGRSLPINVLEQIAEQLVVARSPVVSKESPTPSAPYLYAPPTDSSLPPCLPVGIARLAPLLAVSKPIYAALSPGYAVSSSNGDAYPLRTELYARLCAYFLDVKAAGRRWRYAKRRKAASAEDDWDRDVEGVTNEGLTAHFMQVVKVLRFFKRAAKAMGIPLPAQAFEGTPPEYKGKSSQGIAHLYHDNIETAIVTTFVLMLEDDGKNHHQLRLVSAPLFVDMLVIYRLNEGTGGYGTAHSATGPPVRFNDGWPVENVLNTAAVWCVWLFTTEEKVHSETVPVRETMIRLVLPFVLCPYRYASALVPPTHYTLPLPPPSEDRGGVYQKPCSSQTAHGPYPVYHSFPHSANVPPPVIVASHPARAPVNPVAAPVPAPAHPHDAAAAALAVAPQQDDEAMDVDEDEAQAEVPTLQAGPDAPPVAILHDEANRQDDEDEAHGDDDGAGPAVQAPNLPADAPNPAPNPANDNPLPPAPIAAPAPAPNMNANATPPVSQPATPPPGHTLHISRRPPPTASNSQAHPSYGAYIPWYCSPWKDQGVHQHLRRAPIPPVSYPSSDPHALSSLPPPSSSPRPIQATAPSSSSSSSEPLRGIVIHLPLITAAAKLIFMSRREAIPLPVIPTLPENRAAARAAGWMYAGPTQEDLREMGSWCTWGRRTIWAKVPSEGAAQPQTQNDGGEENEQEGQQGEVGETVVEETAGTDAVNAKPKVEDKALWYADSQRWDTDWWRARLCGSDWQNKVNCFPRSSDTLPSPPLYRTPHESLASRMGRVYERGMLTGLWQGYMHMPNESSLMYIARTRQFPSNFGEQALGVMMRPVLVRFAEHTWVASPVDPGKYDQDECRVCEDEEGPRKGCSEGYWEKGMVGEERVDEEGEWEFEYVAPEGGGPVPIAKPKTMVKHVVPLSPRFDPVTGEMRQASGQPVLGPRATGFLDENMNNAWFPGPVGSLRWNDGSVLPNETGSTRHASAEEGVWDGVWRDRYVSQQGEGGGEEKRLKMKGVTFSIPSTFERGEGVELIQTPRMPAPVPLGHAAAAAAAAPAAAGVAVPAHNVVAPAPIVAPASPGIPAHIGATIVTRLDNPNLPYPEPNPTDPSSSPRIHRTERKVVPPTSHVYETYDPSGVRESVHERMERARGSACRGLRKRKRKSDGTGEDGDNGDIDVEGDSELHVYPHPGCLGCRERECLLERQKEVTLRARMRKRKQRKQREVEAVVRALEERRQEVRTAVKSEEVEDMFRGVGLGLNQRKEDEDEDEEMKVEEFGLDAEDEDQDMEAESEDEDDDRKTETEMQEHQHGDRCKCSSCRRSMLEELAAITYKLWNEPEDDDDDDSSENELESNSSWSDLEDEDEIDLKDSTVHGSCFPPCDSKSAPGDAIVTGSMDDRHAEAWGSFAYYGRVRPWDGLVGILRIGTGEGHLGTRFFFYGYVYGGRNFVGNWRFAALDPVNVGMESSFVLSRRAEA